MLAVRAIPTLFTLLGLSRYLCFIPLAKLVTRGRNHFLCHQDLIASRALGSLGQTVFCASRSHCIQLDGLPSVVAMGQNFDDRSLKVVAIGAIPTLFTLLSFGGGLGLIPLAKLVAGCRNYLLLNQNLATTGALSSLGQTVFCAGRSNRL